MTIDDTLIGTDTHPCASQHLVQKALDIIISKAVLHMPPMHHGVFQLRFEEELPIKERAKPINRREGPIKTSFL